MPDDFPGRSAGGVLEMWRTALPTHRNKRTPAPQTTAERSAGSRSLHAPAMSPLCVHFNVARAAHRTAASDGCLRSCKTPQCEATGRGPAFTGGGPAFTGLGPAFTGLGPAFTGLGPAFTGLGPAFTGLGPAFTGLGPAFTGHYRHIDKNACEGRGHRSQSQTSWQRRYGSEDRQIRTAVSSASSSAKHRADDTNTPVSAEIRKPRVYG
ncbi:unnamed protein product [Lota lota]